MMREDLLNIKAGYPSGLPGVKEKHLSRSERDSESVAVRLKGSRAGDCSYVIVKALFAPNGRLQSPGCLRHCCTRTGPPE